MVSLWVEQWRTDHLTRRLSSPNNLRQTELSPFPTYVASVLARRRVSSASSPFTGFRSAQIAPIPPTEPTGILNAEYGLGP